MNNRELLEKRRNEREVLLRRVVELLEGDERVVAAWLFGSLGRGDADDLSDIDLWVVVVDEHVEEIVVGGHQFITRLGEPLLMVEAPQNAPVDGGYLLALYAGEVGPHQIDWYWQPQSQARIPQQALVLFNRANLQQAEQAHPQSEEERARIVSEQVAFFWAMCNITAKKIVRRQSWSAITMLSMLGQTLNEAAWLTGARDIQPGYGYEGDAPTPVQPVEQLALLRRMTCEIEALLPIVSAMGGTTPSKDAISQINRFLDLTEAMAIEGIQVSNR